MLIYLILGIIHVVLNLSFSFLGPPTEICQGGTRLLYRARRQTETSIKIDDLS